MVKTRYVVEKYGLTFCVETFGMLPNTSTFTIPFRLGNQLFIFAGAEAKKERNYVHNKTFILDMGKSYTIGEN